MQQYHTRFKCNFISCFQRFSSPKKKKRKTLWIFKKLFNALRSFWISWYLPRLREHQWTNNSYISYQSPKIVINIIILNKQCRINTVSIFQAFLSHHFNYLLLHVLMIKLGKVRFLTYSQQSQTKLGSWLCR